MRRPTNLEKVCKSFRQVRRGAAVVEFAIVAPIFVLFIVGVIEYGRMVMVQQVLTNATREGARLAVLDGATEGEVKAAVIDYCTASRISVDESNVEVPTDPSTVEFGDPIAVTVGIPFSAVSWLPSPMYLGARQLSATSIMRKQSTQ